MCAVPARRCQRSCVPGSVGAQCCRAPGQARWMGCVPVARVATAHGTAQEMDLWAVVPADGVGMHLVTAACQHLFPKSVCLVQDVGCLVQLWIKQEFHVSAPKCLSTCGQERVRPCWERHLHS